MVENKIKMPQELQVLQCFNCKYFQVHIVKKRPKWACKICKEKQSIKKVFMKSESGKDCRHLVQELNLHHGDLHVGSPDASSRENELDCSGNNFETECSKDNSMWDEFLHLEDNIYNNNINSQEYNQTQPIYNVGLIPEQNTQSNTQAKNRLPFFESGNSIIDSFDDDEPVPKRSKPCPEPNTDISPVRDKSSRTNSTKGAKKPVISMFEEELCNNETDFKF